MLRQEKAHYLGGRPPSLPPIVPRPVRGAVTKKGEVMTAIEIIVIVAAALFVVAVAGISLWRKKRGKGGCSACGGCCPGCAHAQKGCGGCHGEKQSGEKGAE